MSDELPETFADLETQKCVLTAKVLEFSNDSLHKPGEEVPFDYSVDNKYFRDTFSLSLYANGSSTDNKAWISILFRSTIPHLLQYYKHFELSCVISVIDHSENNRFFKSFTFPYDPNWVADVENIFLTFDVERYIERKTLLNEALDLLPQDTLSLHIEVDIRMTAASRLESSSQFLVNAIVQQSFETEESDTETKYYFSLDSAVAESLTEVSSYFQRISETPMVEKRTRCMTLPADEYPFFTNICNILMGAKSIWIESMEDICQIYVLADKYDVPVAIENCRGMIISFFDSKNDPIIAAHATASLPSLLDLAKTYNDFYLEESIKNVSMNSRSSSRVEEDLEREWKVELAGKLPFFYFVLSKDARNNKEEPEFDFYH